MTYKTRLCIDIENKFFLVYRTKNSLAAESFQSFRALQERIETLKKRKGIKFLAGEWRMPFKRGLIFPKETNHRCSICLMPLSETGTLRTKEGITYCDKCFNKFWDSKEVFPRYKQLFLTCPFCKTVINITTKVPEICPGCRTKINSGDFCPFCEEGYNFIKPKDDISIHRPKCDKETEEVKAWGSIY